MKELIVFINFNDKFQSLFNEAFHSSKTEVLFLKKDSFENKISEALVVFTNDFEISSIETPIISINTKSNSNNELDHLLERDEKKILQYTFSWINDLVRIRRFYDSISEAILIVNKSRIIIYANESCLNLFGYTKKELLFNDLNILLDETVRQRHNNHYAGAVKKDDRKGIRLQNKNNYGIKKNGEIVYADIAVNHLEIGRKAFFLSNIRDITNRRLAEFELEKTNKQLDQYVEELKTSVEHVEMSRKLLKAHAEELQSSLRYASNIQYVFHSNEEKIKDLFPNSFEIFKPQNIVSGDIVWCGHTHLGKMVAVIDCMGHGVPGALLSISVINCMETIARSESFYSVSDFLHKVVKLYVESVNGKISDTFDLSVCLFDKLSRFLFYKGIKRPLEILRNGELETIPGIPMDVMEFYSIPKQSNYLQDDVRPIHKGDRFYMYSDGFPDQFGGPKDKKLKLGTFRKKIIESRNLTMDEQGKFLNNYFENWRTHNSLDNEQIDDVTVVGIEYN